MKKILPILLSLSMAASLNIVGCADEVNATDSILIGDSAQEMESRSFYRSYSGNITGDKWTKIAWDPNIKRESNFRITLDENSTAAFVFFRLQVKGINYDFSLPTGSGMNINVDEPGSFSLFAQYSDIGFEGNISGTISLGNL